MEPFKNSNLMTALYSIGSIPLPCIRTARGNEKRIIKQNSKLLCDLKIHVSVQPYVSVQFQRPALTGSRSGEIFIEHPS